MYVFQVFAYLLVVSNYFQFGDSYALTGPILIRDYPCIGNEAVLGTFETDAPPEEENMYNIGINVGDLYPKGFPMQSEMTIQFDATTSLSLRDNIGRITPRNNGVFYIRFFNTTSYLSLKVKGEQGKATPNFLSIVLNSEELCPNGTKKGSWDSYIRGNVTSGVSSLTVSSSDLGCGRKKVDHNALITNAESTKPGDWPWHAAIYKIGRNSASQKYICGGSLLTSSRVLTAGHCVVEARVKVIPERLFVVLGKYNLAGGDLASQEIGVYQIILNEGFNPSTLLNDIAMLVLSSEVAFGDYIQPICLWERKNQEKTNLYGKLGYVVGWGFNENNALTSSLSKATMPIVPDLTCIRSNAPFFDKFLTPNSYCAGFRNGTSVCNGDSGGGMFFSEEAEDGKLTWRLRGITSLSVATEQALCDPQHYVIFTDAAKYLDWIDSNIKTQQ